MQAKLLLAAAALTLVALPVLGAPRTEDVVLKPGDNPDEVICRAMAPATGSRLNAGRTCATRAQWHQVGLNRAFARRGIEKVQVERVCRQNDCK